MRLGLLLAVLFILGLMAPPIVATPGASSTQMLQNAYDRAWEVSDALEELSNCIVDGLQAFCWDEAKLNEVFAKIIEVIVSLCRSGQVVCKYDWGY